MPTDSERWRFLADHKLTLHTERLLPANHKDVVWYRIGDSRVQSFGARSNRPVAPFGATLVITQFEGGSHG